MNTTGSQSLSPTTVHSFESPNLLNPYTVLVTTLQGLMQSTLSVVQILSVLKGIQMKVAKDFEFYKNLQLCSCSFELS